MHPQSCLGLMVFGYFEIIHTVVYSAQLLSNIAYLRPATIGLLPYPIMLLGGQIQSRSWSFLSFTFLNIVFTFKKETDLSTAGQCISNYHDIQQIHVWYSQASFLDENAPLPNSLALWFINVD